MLRQGWHCQFLEEDLKTALPRKLTFATPDKIMELVERTGALRVSRLSSGRSARDQRGQRWGVAGAHWGAVSEADEMTNSLYLEKIRMRAV